MFGCVLTVTAVRVVMVVGIENGDAWWCTEKRKDGRGIRGAGRRGERSIVADGTDLDNIWSSLFRRFGGQKHHRSDSK